MSDASDIMNGEGDNDLMAFVALHAGALQAAGVPQIYWSTLHHKLNNEVYLLQTFFFSHMQKYPVLFGFKNGHCVKADGNIVILCSFDRCQLTDGSF